MDMIERINCYRFNPPENKWVLLHEIPEEIPQAPGDFWLGEGYTTGKGRLDKSTEVFYDSKTRTLHINPRYRDVMNLADLIEKSKSFSDEGVYIILERINGWFTACIPKVKSIELVDLVIEIESKAIPEKKALPPE